MAFYAPFDLQHWFVNVFAGNYAIFIALAFLVIAIGAAIFRMPTIITGVMFALFAVMLSYYTGEIYLLAIILISLGVFWGLARLIKY